MNSLKLVAILSLGLSLAACSETEPAAPAAPPAEVKKEEPAAPAAPAAPPAAEAQPAAAASGSTGVPECDEYLATFEKVAACDKMGAALEPMKQSVQAQKDAFAQWASFDEATRAAAQAAAGPGCKAGTDSLIQSAQAMGCSL